MKKKGMVKFKGTLSKGLMHYVEYNNDYVSITRKSSRKIKDIKKTGKLNITFGLLSREYRETPVSIVEDEQTIQNVFNYMKNEKHTH